MKLIALVTCALMLQGCVGRETKPDEAIVVERVVEKTRSPAWAVTDIEKPVPQDGTVYSKLRALDALSNAFDFMLCHRRLQRDLNKDKAVDPKTCEVKK